MISSLGKVVFSLGSACFLCGGTYCLGWPRAVRRRVLEELQRKGKPPSRFVLSDWFLWFVRAAGLIFIAVGIRSLLIVVANG